MDLGLSTGCAGVASDLRRTRGLQEILVGIHEIMQALTVPTPYWFCNVYIIVAIKPQPTTSEQSTLKILNNAFSGIPYQSPSSPFRNYTLPVSPLGNLPKRLGPRVKFNQKGLCFSDVKLYMFSYIQLNIVYKYKLLLA